MAKIRAFKGVRPRAEIAKTVCAPPYDVINSDEARKMAEGNPQSFLYVDKPEIALPVNTDLYSPEVYAAGRKALERLMAEGVLVKDATPMLYVYQQEWRGAVQTGLIACVAVDDYDEDLVKKHEKTRKDKEDDRARHVDVTGANAGLVFLTYRASSEIDRILAKVMEKKPVYDFVTADEVTHRLFLVDDQATIDMLVTGFSRISPLYVADGHHRAASGSRVRALRRDRNPKHTGNEEYNFVMCGIFPDEQLRILAYNRVLKDLNGHCDDDFMKKLSEKFEIEKCGSAPELKLHQFGMYMNGAWLRLTAKPASFDAKHPVESLDAAILQNNVLAPLLGIDDPRTSKHIDFIGGIHGTPKLESLVNSGKFKLAFALYPTSMAQLMAVADAGMMMPPKSTWFEPKLRSGVVVHLLD